MGAVIMSNVLNDPLLTGADGEAALMAVEHAETGGRPDAMVLFLRRDGHTIERREDGLPALKAGFERAIRGREWPVTRLAKTETLQDAPATYAGKIGEKARGRSAAYELALRSKRDYRAGDQVSYYVTGAKKSVPVHAAAKLVADWNPVERDENVPYYVAKLEALYAKFCGGRLGGEEGE
jgi:hypothetical protein